MLPRRSASPPLNCTGAGSTLHDVIELRRAFACMLDPVSQPSVYVFMVQSLGVHNGLARIPLLKISCYMGDDMLLKFKAS